MGELLKREVSLTVLRVQLLDGSASSGASTGAGSTASQTLSPNQRILCELQVTGTAKERGMVAPTGHPTQRSPSRRKCSSPRPTYEEGEDSSSAPRTVAQWSFAPAETQLPVQFSEAMQFRDRPNFASGFIADLARAAVFRLFNEIRADTFERFASAKIWLPSGKPMLPSAMTRQLQSLLPSVMRTGDSLWLELAEPAGYLPLLPWEEMLRPVTGVPILRLSPHAVQALSPDRELAVVLCLTVPSEKWTPSPDQLASMASAIRRSLPEGSTLHVFADDICHAPFAAAKERVGSDDAERRVIKLYDFSRKDGLDKEKLRDDPWMTWVTASLEGRAVDIVHCMAPGLLFADHARLVVAREPGSGEKPTGAKRKSAPAGGPALRYVTPLWSSIRRMSGRKPAGGPALRYVTPLEFCESLTLLGAWAAVCSAPARGSWLVQSRMGLRLLIDQIARSRPGVAAFHDFDADPECEALAATYAFMIGDPSIAASTSPSISMYCHPARATPVSTEPTSASSELMQQYAKVKETILAAIARGGPLPAWVAATQRIVEQAVSRVATEEVKGPDDPAMRGLAAALEYVKQMLAEQAHTGASQKSTSVPTQGGGSTSV